MAEEAIIVLRKSHAWTIRPRQWHVTRWGHIVKKEFREGVSLDMTEGMVVATTLMHPTKTPGYIYVEKTPE